MENQFRSVLCSVLKAAVAVTLSFMVVLVPMDLFEHRYYILSKTLMTLIGHWPYQSARVRHSRVAIVLCLGIGQLIPIMLALVKYRDDWKIVLDSLLPLLFLAVYTVRVIGLMWNSQKILKLLNRIRTDWEVWAPDEEVKILSKYSDRGGKLSILYTAVIYSVLSVFMTQPVISKIINVLWMNGTEPAKFPYPVDYYNIDMQKYYFYIIMYSCLCLSMPCMVVVASDVMLITNVQHGCGIFAAVGHKLERIINNDSSAEKEGTPHTLDERDFLYQLASCIDRHNDAIEYANLVENSYRWSFFFVIGIGMCQLNLLGLQILLRKGNTEENTKFIAFVLAIIFMFLVYSELSQILMDHSISIRFHIHNSQWYRLSVKAQKLLQFMTMRSIIPCQLTAGKMLVMCLRNFMLTLRTAMSYFTVVRTMQSL